MSAVAEVLARVLCARNDGTTLTDWPASGTPCATCCLHVQAQAAALAPLFDTARREAVERAAEAVDIAFSGDDYEENAQEAACEGEWSWFRWLARQTVATFAAEQWPGEA